MDIKLPTKLMERVTTPAQKRLKGYVEEFAASLVEDADRIEAARALLPGESEITVNSIDQAFASARSASAPKQRLAQKVATSVVSMLFAVLPAAYFAVGPSSAWGYAVLMVFILTVVVQSVLLARS